jgi:hypothetical protein
MARAKDARKVALDMTVIRHFHDSGFLVQLITYLPNAYVAPDVYRELTLQAKSRPQLQNLEKARWPKQLDPLPTQLVERGLVIQQEWLEEGNRPDAHLGEIYTVLAAAHFGIDLIITDDGDGLKLASTEGIRAIRGGELTAEMVVEGALDLEAGWAVYQLTRRKPSRENYERLVRYAGVEAKGSSRDS